MWKWMLIIVLPAVFFTAAGEDRVYLNLEGYYGSVSEPGHIDWIDCALFSHSCPSIPSGSSCSSENSFGSAEGSELAGVEFTVLVKENDLSTPRLFSDYLTGLTLPGSFDISVVDPDTGGEISYSFQGVDFNRCRAVDEGLELVYSCEAVNWSLSTAE